MAPQSSLLLALAGCSWFAETFRETKEPLPGKRISVLSLDRPVAVDPKEGAIPVRLPPPYDNPAWPDAGGYPSHAMYHLALGDKLVKIWTADVGDGAGRYGRVDGAAGGR